MAFSAVMVYFIVKRILFDGWWEQVDLSRFSNSHPEDDERSKSMNSRQQALALKLLKQTHYETTKDLAQQLAVSERTLRSDLNVLEEYLVHESLVLKLDRKKGIGIKLEGSPSEKEQLKKKISQHLHGLSLDEKKSEELLTFHLLMAKEGQSLEELAEKLFVSRMEIKRILEQIETVFTSYHLELISKPRIGTLVEGPERRKRELLAKTLREIQKIDPQTVTLKNFFSRHILTVIQEVLKKELQAYSIEYSSELSSIDIHIYFMLERMWQGESVVLSDYEHQLVAQTEAQQLSRQIMARLATIYPIAYTENEIDYLALRLSSILSKEQTEKAPVGEAERLAKHLITQVERLMGIAFHQDEGLKLNLIAHLSSTYFRISGGFSISNPLTKDILGTYTHLFVMIQMILEEFFAEENFYIPQEEIAYLTVHFQAALERNQEKQAKVFRTILVSQYSHSMATFLEARLNREIPELTITEVVRFQEETEQTFPETDFILSTLPIADPGQPTLIISPMITETDIQQIKKYMLEHTPKKRTQHFDLARFTSPFLVYPQLDFEEMTELLRFLGQPLVNHQYVHPDFVSSLIERESRSSTKVAPLIATPHGNPRYVETSTISIATLQQPMDWHGEKVQLVLLLSIKPEELKELHFKKIFSVIHYLEKTPNKLYQVLKEKNPLRIIHLLSEYE